MKRFEVITEGQCVCHCAPMGNHGLEGYDLNSTYYFQKVIKNNKEHFRLFPNPDNLKYYECCGPKVFGLYFEITSLYLHK